MAQDPNQNRPADVAQADSVGGMAKRLLNPAHLADLARRSAATPGSSRPSSPASTAPPAAPCGPTTAAAR